MDSLGWCSQGPFLKLGICFEIGINFSAFYSLIDEVSHSQTVVSAKITGRAC